MRVYVTRVRKYHPRAARNNAARKHEPKSQERAQAMEPPPLTGRSPKRRARRSSNQDVIPPSVTAACKTGDDAVVAQFLAVRSNLLQLDTHAEDTSTLLHVAAESGTTKVIELLLANGASHRSMWKRALPQVIARVPPLVVGGPVHTPDAPRRAELGFLSEASVACFPYVFHCQPLGGAASTRTDRRRCTWRPRRGTSTPSKARCILQYHIHAHALLTTHYPLLTTRLRQRPHPRRVPGAHSAGQV